MRSGPQFPGKIAGMTPDVMVYHGGELNYITQDYIESYCPIHDPFDVINCTMKYGSWTTSGDVLDIQVHPKDVDTSEYESGCPSKVSKSLKINKFL